jgi:hypothetical protein
LVEVFNEQRSDEFGRLDLRKVPYRRRVVQHIDAGQPNRVSNTR